LWKFESFGDNIRWVWDKYLEHTETQTQNKALTMAHLIGATFGIAMKDLRGACRDQTISVPRMLGMALLRKDGQTYAQIRRAFHKDPKSAAYAVEKMAPITELLHERVSGRGHPSISQSTGRVQTRFPEVATEDGEDDQA
jgi:chromosomal replication initiation ATPase DnaA